MHSFKYLMNGSELNLENLYLLGEKVMFMGDELHPWQIWTKKVFSSKFSPLIPEVNFV